MEIFTQQALENRGSWEECLKFFRSVGAGKASVSNSSLSQPINSFWNTTLQDITCTWITFNVFMACVWCVIEAVADCVSYDFRPVAGTTDGNSQRESSLHWCLLWFVLHLCCVKRGTCLWIWPHQLSPAGLVWHISFLVLLIKWIDPIGVIILTIMVSRH